MQLETGRYLKSVKSSQFAKRGERHYTDVHESAEFVL